ncbi:MAG: nucleotidyltransferase domain-containing protein [Bdellovibrionaceae bacterium]|nr:nucleotidyltransferase domain-containing protein [Pseudobdellovibrionaceae bacterium]
MTTIQLEPKHLAIVKSILKKREVNVFVFGSRVKDAAKPLSDLDLCIKNSYRKSKLRELQDDLEESDLPFKVDIVIWSDLSVSFQKQIEKDLVALLIR